MSTPNFTGSSQTVKLKIEDTTKGTNGMRNFGAPQDLADIKVFDTKMMMVQAMELVNPVVLNPAPAAVGGVTLDATQNGKEFGLGKQPLSKDNGVYIYKFATNEFIRSGEFNALVTANKLTGVHVLFGIKADHEYAITSKSVVVGTDPIVFKDESDVAVPVVSANSRKVTLTQAVTAVGQPVTYAGALAQAVAGKNVVYGFAKTIGAIGDEIEVYFRGSIKGLLAGLTPSKNYYLSDATAGAVLAAGILPTTAGNYEVSCYWAIAADEVEFDLTKNDLIY